MTDENTTPETDAPNPDNLTAETVEETVEPETVGADSGSDLPNADTDEADSEQGSETSESGFVRRLFRGLLIVTVSLVTILATYAILAVVNDDDNDGTVLGGPDDPTGILTSALAATAEEIDRVIATEGSFDPFAPNGQPRGVRSPNLTVVSNALVQFPLRGDGYDLQVAVLLSADAKTYCVLGTSSTASGTTLLYRSSGPAGSVTSRQRGDACPDEAVYALGQVNRPNVSPYDLLQQDAREIGILLDDAPAGATVTVVDGGSAVTSGERTRGVFMGNVAAISVDPATGKRCVTISRANASSTAVYEQIYRVQGEEWTAFVTGEQSCAAAGYTAAGTVTPVPLNG